MITFSVDAQPTGFSLVSFEIPGGTLDVAALRQIQPPLVDATKGVILSGRGPVWLFCFLAHCYHPTAWIATLDPRLGGAVVVESHSPAGPKVGEIVPI